MRTAPAVRCRKSRPTAGGAEISDRTSRGRESTARDLRSPQESSAHGTACGRGPLLLQLLHADVAVADELLRVVAAAVDLQRDAALVGQALLRVLVLHELHALDPRG